MAGSPPQVICVGHWGPQKHRKTLSYCLGSVCLGQSLSRQGLGQRLLAWLSSHDVAA